MTSLVTHKQLAQLFACETLIVWFGKTRGSNWDSGQAGSNELHLWEDEDTWASALKECGAFPTTQHICVSILISCMFSVKYHVVIQECLLLHTWLLVVWRTTTSASRVETRHCVWDRVLSMASSFEIVSSYWRADDLHSLFFLWVRVGRPRINLVT